MLENQAYIVAYQAILDYTKIGKEFEMQIFCILHSASSVDMAIFEKELLARPEVVFVEMFDAQIFSIRILTETPQEFTSFVHAEIYSKCRMESIRIYFVTRKSSPRTIDLLHLHRRTHKFKKNYKRK